MKHAFSIGCVAFSDEHLHGVPFRPDPAPVNGDWGPQTRWVAVRADQQHLSLEDFPRVTYFLNPYVLLKARRN